MAWHKDSVAKFLLDRSVDPDIATVINARMEEIADSKGMFAGGELDRVMGNVVLAQSYRKAWEGDDTYAARHFMK